MDKYRLFCPPVWLPWYLYPVWPLIWLRIRQLKGWLQANGKAGSMILWGVDVYGRVVIRHMSDDLSGHTPKPEPFTFQPSRAFRAALSGDEPSSCLFCSSRRRPGPSDWLEAFAALLVPGLRRDERALRLPLPDT